MKRVELSSRLEDYGIARLQVLQEDSGLAFCRGWLDKADGDGAAVLLVVPASEPPASHCLERLAREYALKDELDGAWAARPLQLLRERGQTLLLLEDPGGEFLSAQLGAPMDVEHFLRVAVGVAVALGKAHQRGITHKDVKPANVLVNGAHGEEARLTGFGVASRLARERPSPDPPELIAGTLAYMAPEQTGRMNRPLDSRADLYALGVTLYEMLTGSLPFAASDPLEWMHCHIARTAKAPHERTSRIPEALSSIVMKLLAKNPEERYQTAAGVEADLRICLNDWRSHGEIRNFPLGSRDAARRLLIPEKLYGRDRELEQLLTAFDRVLASGRLELMLVTGQAGVGKSSFVNELHKALLPSRGVFAVGKCDQNRANIPYAAFAQALRQLIAKISAEPEAELARYRTAILTAVEPYGQLIVNVIPELERVIGTQPSTAELAPQDAQRVFERVLRRFIGVFVRQERPLVLFLDDLQWIDTATLDMLQHLLLQEEVKSLFLVGAYRDNEVGPDQPLMRRLAAIREAGAPVSEIPLATLSLSDVRALVADALRDNQARPLAELVHAKAAGNPLFAIQFLTALADDGLVAFEPAAVRWTWDVPRIAARSFGDDIIVLMVEKILGLPIHCREAMQAMACLGATARTEALAAILDVSPSDVDAALSHAIEADLVALQSAAYVFRHDRIQEASYALIAEAERPGAHLRVARRLYARTAPVQLDDRLFEIVDQFNRGLANINDRDELDRVAELNLKAGQRAKAAAAFATALAFLRTGAEALGETGWRRRRALAFAFAFEQGECEFLTGDLAQAETRLSALNARAEGWLELAALACLRIMLHVTRGEPARSVEICLECLEHQGIHFTPHPSRKDVEGELERMWRTIGGRALEELALSPETTDATTLATLEVLAAAASPAWFSDPLLPALIGARIVNISIERGTGPASSFGYAMLAMKLGPFSGDYRTAYHFGKLALELAERRSNPRILARVLFGYTMFVRPWADDLEGCRELLQRGFEAAERAGDLTYATYLLCNFEELMLIAGSRLDETEAACRRALAYARKLNFDFAVLAIHSQLGLTRTLRGETDQFGSFDSADFNQHVFERAYSDVPALALPMCWYWVRRQQALFLAGDAAGSLAATEAAEPLLWVADVYFEFAEHHLYAALARAECLDSADEATRQSLRDKLEASVRKLAAFGENSPITLGSRAALAAAELARVDGREREAMDLYEQAIRSARAAGFVHIEALGFELAARFYAARGFGTFADAYLHKAWDRYLRWGALGKTRQLDRLYPHLFLSAVQAPAAPIVATMQQLDAASVVKASQALSGEIELPKLIDRLMTIALENAGAGRALLILPAGSDYAIRAEAQTTGTLVEVTMRQEPVAGGDCPESVIRHVIRTHESVLLDDAYNSTMFTDDAYLSVRRPRSILCLPLISQREFRGVFLLENELTSHAFTPRQIAVLELLAAQAAISLENARLYGELQEREAKVRRLIEANIIGICFIDTGGRIVDANDAFLRMLGYGRGELGSDRLSWERLTPPEWTAANFLRLEDVGSRERLQPFESEFFRKDGGRAPVLVSVTRFEEAGGQAVAFVIDLTDRKRAESRELQLRLLVDSIAAPLALMTATGEVDVVNASVLEYFGKTLDELKKWSTIDAVHPEDLPSAAAAWRQAVETSQPYQIESRHRRADGVYRWFHVRGFPIRDLNGAIIRWCVLQTDIDDRKKAEEALATNERDLNIFINTIPALVWSASIDGRAEFFNKHYLDYIGAASEPLQGWGWTSVVHPEDMEALTVAWRRIMASGEMGEAEARLRRRDGMYRWFLLRASPLRDESGQITKWLGVNADIEELKRAEAAIRESELRLREAQMELAHANRIATMGQLAASIAHEVNQPIAALLTNAETAARWLDRQPPNVERGRPLIDRIIGDGRRTADIVMRIREFSKKAPMRSERLHVNESIMEIMRLTRSVASERGVSVTLQLSEGLPGVLGDRIQIQQVILNLVMNAIEAMDEVEPGSRNLVIGTREYDPSSVLVEVRDSGPGLPESKPGAIFEPFYTTKSGGLGMGLSICRSIVDAHGGNLWAAPNEPRGALFRLRLPIGRESFEN